MSSLKKVTQAESAAYQKMVSASAEVIDRVLSGIEDEHTARLRRRSTAYRAAWLATARKLEEVASRTEA